MNPKVILPIKIQNEAITVWKFRLYFLFEFRQNLLCLGTFIINRFQIQIRIKILHYKLDNGRKVFRVLTNIKFIILSSFFFFCIKSSIVSIFQIPLLFWSGPVVEIGSAKLLLFSSVEYLNNYIMSCCPNRNKPAFMTNYKQDKQ
jgi:hypothetical protein